METDHQLRILYLYQILLRHSDVDHPVSTKELIDMMETYHQIKLHRTTIPKYIEPVSYTHLTLPTNSRV